MAYKKVSREVSVHY